MEKDHSTWQDWAQSLHRWGISNWVAAFLEAAGPLTIIGAQAIYLTNPILKNMFTDEKLNALTQMLEEPGETHAFVTYLREAQHVGNS